MAENGLQGRCVADEVMKLWIPQKYGLSLPAKQLLFKTDT